MLQICITSWKYVLPIKWIPLPSKKEIPWFCQLKTSDGILILKIRVNTFVQQTFFLTEESPGMFLLIRNNWSTSDGSYKLLQKRERDCTNTLLRVSALVNSGEEIWQYLGCAAHLKCISHADNLLIKQNNLQPRKNDNKMCTGRSSRNCMMCFSIFWYVYFWCAFLFFNVCIFNIYIFAVHSCFPYLSR